MKRIICFCFLLLSLLTGCSSNKDPIYHDTIEIYSGWEPSHKLWGGVFIAPDIVSTSAHILRDDRNGYSMRGWTYDITPLSILLRDDASDTAFLEIGDASLHTTLDWINTLRAQIATHRARIGVGSGVMVRVRNGTHILVKTGTVLNTSGTLLALWNLSQLEKIHGILLTDINFESGESGSPIFDMEGNLVDVVHVK